MVQYSFSTFATLTSKRSVFFITNLFVLVNLFSSFFFCSSYVKYLKSPLLGAKSVRFNSNSTRLIYSEINGLLVCHDLPTNMRLNETGKVLFTAQGYDIQDNNLRRSPCCFAGDYDRLVVGASSHDHGIYLWSSASNGEGEQSVDRPVRVLRGHRAVVRSVRYNVQNDVLASCGEEGTIKLWSTDAF